MHLEITRVGFTDRTTYVHAESERATQVTTTYVTTHMSVHTYCTLTSRCSFVLLERVCVSISRLTDKPGTYILYIAKFKD